MCTLIQFLGLYTARICSHYISLVCLLLTSSFCFRLRWDAIRNSHVTMLRLFVDSIFIQTQISIQEGDLLPDQLGMGAPLLSSQRERLRLVSKLLLVMDVAGWINDPSLSLQAAIMSYTLLVPLIQLGIMAKPLLKVRVKTVWFRSSCHYRDYVLMVTWIFVGFNSGKNKKKQFFSFVFGLIWATCSEF